MFLSRMYGRVVHGGDIAHDGKDSDAPALIIGHRTSRIVSGLTRSCSLPSTGLLLLAGATVPLAALVPAGGAQGSPMIDPQPGATRRPIAPQTVPVLPTQPVMASEMATRPSPVPAEPLPPMRAPQGGLPAPSDDPLRIDPTTDPVLMLARSETSMGLFRDVIGAAVIHNPTLDEAGAQVDEVVASRQEAKARAQPVLDLSLSTFQVIDRAFSNDPNNVLERSRPRERTDGLLRVQQPIIDFGASLSRIRAAQARLVAAQANVEDTAARIALQAVSAWYTVYGYRVLVRLSTAFIASQQALRDKVEKRIRQGAAASGDLAQIDSYLASSSAQLAGYRRQLAAAEAQYTAVVGAQPPANLARAPAPSLDGIAGAGDDDTERLPVVRAARAGVTAARADVRALQGDRMPQLSAGIDAGRYGILQNANDYDVRGNLTLSMRLGGGAEQRIDQAQARLVGADARLRRTRIEARRDVEIAFADVAALNEAQVAIEGNYLASRRSRDVLAERFRVSRGTLFDLLIADNNYFNVAARFVQTMIELDTARYALLASTGRLLPLLDIHPVALEPR